MTDRANTAGGALTGKSAIVTGGSRGIGRAIVERLANDGATVVFSYLSNEIAAQEVVDEVQASSGNHVWAVRADMGKVTDVENLFACADTYFSEVDAAGLDILVNNAGLLVDTSIAKVTEDEYDRLMAVNSKGCFFAIQQAESRMRDGGRIINVSSLNTAWSSAKGAVYTASKAAVEQFSRVAARELAKRKITVNTVSPGLTNTDMLRDLTTESLRSGIARIIPLGRLGEADDIAEVVAFLAGPGGRWITGQNIRTDGGLT